VPAGRLGLTVGPGLDADARGVDAVDLSAHPDEVARDLVQAGNIDLRTERALGAVDENARTDRDTAVCLEHHPRAVFAGAVLAGDDVDEGRSA
jgi:hypothetical protein